MLVQLSQAQGRVLFDRLQNDNRSDSLAVRGLLWSIVQGKIGTGRIFVDEWPAPSHCCCLYDVLEYCPNSMDIATIFSNKPNQIDAFLNSVKKERRWNEKGVIFAAIAENLEMPIMRTFPEEDLYRGGPLMVVVDPSPGVKDATSAPPLPPELRLDYLRPEEAEFLASHWHYGHPHKVDMFRWLISNFPQACVRNSAGELIAWELEYEIGAGAARFTRPEYRKLRLSQALSFPKLSVHYRYSPVPAFGTIENDNFESQRLARNVLGFVIGNDGDVVWMRKDPKQNSKL